MIIDCIADAHGHFPELPGGDLLIIAGDLTARDRAHELMDFGEWVQRQNYSKKIVIAGNHDNLLAGGRWNICPPKDYGWDFEYLCDSGTEFTIEEDDEEMERCGMHPSVERTFKIWGSPWTKTFEGMNPHCKAFTVDTEEELAEKWALIPDDTDILITHSPPYGFLDQNIYGKHCGSRSLTTRFLKINPQLLVYGHIHEWGGKRLDFVRTRLVNASHVNERYQAVNKPIRIEL